VPVREVETIAPCLEKGLTRFSTKAERYIVKYLAKSNPVFWLKLCGVNYVLSAVYRHTEYRKTFAQVLTLCITASPNHGHEA
jgi:hypothetical protein